MATFGELETDVEPIAGLLREHLLVFELVTDAREAIERAMAAAENAETAVQPTAEELAEQALELAKDLAAFLAEDLVVHIAKEEDVLFPVLRGLVAGLDKVVDEMVEQHDEIRLRKDMVERAVAHLGETHDEVRDAGEEFRNRVAVGASLAELHDALKRLDWIFQGHFGDEEDDLFPIALELLSAEQFEELAGKAAALEG